MNRYFIIARAWLRYTVIHRLLASGTPMQRGSLQPGFDVIEKKIRELVKQDSYDIFSFDIFDTLIRRRIDPPELTKQLVAQYMSKILAANGIFKSAEEILEQRNSAEKALQRKAVSTGNDATSRLASIIPETLSALKAGSAIYADGIISYEIELEKRATCPMPGAREILSYLKSLDKRIICISETYLSLEQVSEILEYHDLLKYIDRIYLSSDTGRSKVTGNLIKHAIESEDKKIVHTGDNYELDRVLPEKLGVKTLWFYDRSENLRKKKLRKLFINDNKMNYVNAVIGSDNRDKGALFQIGYEVLGPALTVFIHNVAERARKDGIETIFFVARDGYAMKKLYDKLHMAIGGYERLPAGKYLCLSRFPVRLASLDMLTSEDAMEVKAYMSRYGRKSVSLSDILRSYALDPADFLDVAGKHTIDPDAPFADPAHNTGLLQLLDSEEFQQTVRFKSDEGRTLLREYLAGIGFMGKSKVALVDANSEANTQSRLERAFRDDKECPKIFGYYFNLLNLNEQIADSSSTLERVNGVITDWREHHKHAQQPFSFFGLLVELFAHPNHGITVGYRRVDGRVVPVFRKTSQESQYHTTSQVLQGIMNYARDYSMFYPLHGYDSDDLLQHTRRNILEWTARPPKKHVEAFKDLFVTSDWPQESTHRLIEQITIADILKIKPWRNKAWRSGWPEAVLSTAPIPGFRALFRRTFRSIEMP